MQVLPLRKSVQSRRHYCYVNWQCWRMQINPTLFFGHFTWYASMRGVWNLSLQARYTATIRITLLAENRGFEPLEVLPSTVFKTVAFNHSANFPDSVWVCTSLTNKRQSDRQCYLPDICTVNAYIGALPDRLVFLHAKPMKPCKWRKLQVPTLLAFWWRPNDLANRPLCQHWVNFHINNPIPVYFGEKPSIGKQFELSLFLILVDPTTFTPHIGQRRGNLILLASPVNPLGLFYIWNNSAFY